MISWAMGTDPGAGCGSRTPRSRVCPLLPLTLPGLHSETHQHPNTPQVKFYSFLGMSLLKTLSFPDAKFDLYFLGFDSPKAVSGGSNLWDREGLIELTHNYGTENDPDYKVSNGNVEPHRGFGHTCVSVDNLQAACARLEAAGYKFQKKLTDGRMRHIAFVLDPDGYWVELIGQKPVEETEGVTTTDLETYRMVNHRPFSTSLLTPPPTTLN